MSCDLPSPRVSLPAAQPMLYATALYASFPAPLAELQHSDELCAGLRGAAPPAEYAFGDLAAVRNAVRALLRDRGYKPSGRGKPASEYLQGVLEKQGTLPQINAAVDACNVASLCSGIPISLVDLQRTEGEDFRIEIADFSQEYVFNSAGQTIKIGGLPCLFDALGPCANAVKDSQRTKTTPHTRFTLSILWGPSALREHTERATHYHAALLRSVGGSLIRAPVRARW